VLFPKLFRRLTTFLADNHRPLSEFPEFLAETREQLLDLDSGNFTHFDNIVAVAAGRVSLTLDPERIVFVSAKPKTTGRAPWVAI
jgi:hypothetical protein